NDLLQSLFFGRTAMGQGPYWHEVSGQAARGICKLVLRINEPLSMKSLLEWHHPKLKDGTLQYCFSASPTDSDIYQNLVGFMNLTAENTRTCIESTFDQLTGLFSSSKALTDMMSNTTFTMEKIGKKKTAIFLVVPDEKTTYHFLATLFITPWKVRVLCHAARCGC